MAEEAVERVFELRSSAMFPIDDQAAFADHGRSRQTRYVGALDQQQRAPA